MNIRYLICGLAAALILPTAAIAAGEDGNRYGKPRSYHSEISAASAYLQTLNNSRHSHSYRHKKGGKALIIDVRTIEEYVGGHPPGAYSIPYPHVYNRQKDPDKGEYIAQTNEAFLDAVNAMDLPKDTLIITMCRTGSRSVAAGNLLAAEGYTNVRNMWQGFKGNLKQNTNGEVLDLDGNGVVDGSDPYSGDLDGWANFQGLPVSMKLRHSQLFKPYMYIYYEVDGER
jgi:rhodanese-related sulfurtransferase